MRSTLGAVALGIALTWAGKRGRLKIYPPHGMTPMGGHAGFCNRGQAQWGADVLAFLRDPSR